MRRVKRARTPFFFRYCFTFERSSLWGKEKKRKKRKKEERKVCLESANEISPSRKELLRRFSLNWGLESEIFHSSRDCFNRLIHRESDWATSYSPIFEIVALRRWTTTNEKSRRIFFFFFFEETDLRSFQTRNSLVYLFRVIIISTLQPSKILSLNIKRLTNIRKCFPFFQPPCFLFATRTAGKFLRKLSVQKNSFSRLFEYSNRAQWR